MADSKITALGSIGTGTDPANDQLVIVDVSDVLPTGMATTGTTKRVGLNQLLSSSPTATGAFSVTGLVTAGSAAVTGAATVGTTLGVTGNLTVGTNALIVFPATNRVLINQSTALQGDSLEISAKSDGGTISLFGRASDNGATLTFRANGATTAKASFTANDSGLTIRTGTVERYNIDTTGVSTWSVAGTTAMTLNSTGLGIGVSPVYKFHAVVTSGAVGAFRATTAAIARLLVGNTVEDVELKVNANGDGQLTANASKYLGLGSGGINDRVILDVSGNLLVGTTGALSSGSTFQNLGTSRQVLTLKGDAFGSYTAGIWNASTTNDGLFVYFGTEASLTVRGGISYNRAGGLVAYNTTSDYRAKDIIGPVSNSGSLIDSLKVYVGKMKGATIERPMLIAHEAQAVAPYAVTGVKDEVDADGKDKYQQMDVSSFVPLLIAEIQSLRARVQTLETR